MTREKGGPWQMSLCPVIAKAKHLVLVGLGALQKRRHVNWDLENDEFSKCRWGKSTLGGRAGKTGSICKVPLVWNSMTDPFGNCKHSQRDLRGWTMKPFCVLLKTFEKRLSTIVWFQKRIEGNLRHLHFTLWVNREPPAGFGQWNMGWRKHASSETQETPLFLLVLLGPSIKGRTCPSSWGSFSLGSRMRCMRQTWTWSTGWRRTNPATSQSREQ